MEPIRLTSNELILYGAIAGGVMGLFFGIIVLILGLVKKERSYAVFGFLGSVILGPISGILSLIVVAIFTWLILRRPRNTISDSPSSAETLKSESFDAAVPESKTSDSDIS